MDRITNTHIYFWGSQLSNWYACEFNYKRKYFYNSEQAYMWEKAIYFNDNEVAEEILKTPDPRIVKKLGRLVKGFDTEVWNAECYDIMVDVCFEKFSQNVDLQLLLISTGDKILVEASPHDKIWGVGLHWKDDKILDEANWDGQNLLGKALMEVRKIIKDGGLKI